MRRNVLQNFMPVKLKDIDQDIVQDAINEEAKTHAPKSVRDMHGFITAVLKQNRVNLMLTTVLPKKVRLERYIPSDDDIKRLIDTVKATCGSLHLAVNTCGWTFTS